jgi:hypothetical protein
MSKKTLAGLALGMTFAAAGITLATTASAEDEFDVAVAGNAITVVAKGAWHINKDYPWKVVQGDSKLDKSKFDLSEKAAKVSGAPKGKNTVKGAICSGDSCKTFEKDVNVN